VLLSLGSEALAQAVPARRASAPSTPWRLDRTTFDDSVSACTDFYRHVCGGWDVPANVPRDRPSAQWVQDQVDLRNDQALKELLLGEDPPPDVELGRLRTFVYACMAEDREVEEAASTTLARWLTLIESISTHEELMSVLRELHAHGVLAFFRYEGFPDSHDSARYRADIHQGALGLLAAASLTSQDRFDPRMSEHPLALAALAELAPHIDWVAYLRMVGHLPGQPVNVTSPKYLEKLDEIVATTPIEDIRAYLRWSFLDTLGPALPRDLAAEHYRFSSWPAQERQPRFAECTLETLKALGVELSRQFSLHIIGTDSRQRARVVAQQVQEEMIGPLAGPRGYRRLPDRPRQRSCGCSM
jgi:predicted metalloendopeptidase